MLQILNDQSNAFFTFSLLHLYSVFIPIVLFIVFALLTKKYFNNTKLYQIVLIISTIPAFCVLLRMLILYMEGNFTLKEELPIHLCRILALSYPIALYYRNTAWVNAFYFLIYAGTLQAIVTPDLAFGPPHYSYFLYWAMHTTLLMLPFMVVYLLKIVPSVKDMKFAFFIGNVYLISTLIINYLIDSNYFYTLRKPTGPSLLDFMGPWPLYLLFAEFIAIVLFVISYLPIYYSRNIIQSKSDL